MCARFVHHPEHGNGRYNADEDHECRSYPEPVRRQFPYMYFGDFVVSNPFEVSRVAHGERFCRWPKNGAIADGKMERGCLFGGPEVDVERDHLARLQLRLVCH